MNLKGEHEPQPERHNWRGKRGQVIKGHTSVWPQCLDLILRTEKRDVFPFYKCEDYGLEDGEQLGGHCHNPSRTS